MGILADWIQPGEQARQLLAMENAVLICPPVTKDHMRWRPVALDSVAGHTTTGHVQLPAAQEARWCGWFMVCMFDTPAIQ